MAIWQTRIFHSTRDMLDFLNGAIISPVLAPAEGLNLDGKTLIVDIGAGNVTVTFTAKGSLWTMAEIVAEINGTATLTGLSSKLLISQDHAQYQPGRSQLKLDRDGALTVKSTGTSNADFGFSTTADTVSTEYADTDVQTIQQNHEEQDAWLVTVYA